jgi:putative FmdB family regulatory protein
MPTYDFRCTKCKRSFTVNISFRDYEKGKVKCPRCGGQNVQQQITSFMTKTSRKS